LEIKKLKEEQATVEEVLQMLKDGIDVRRKNWSPKQVRDQSFPYDHTPPKDEKERLLYNPSSLMPCLTPGLYEMTSDSDYLPSLIHMHTFSRGFSLTT
jgi:hypothetical protein